MTRNGARCLVTGGAGFIGCALSEGLSKRFDRVVAIDRLHPQVHPHAARPDRLSESVELVVADICDPTAWDSILRSFKPNLVIHLAAETGTGQSLAEASRHAHTNVVGTTQMLDALVRTDSIPERIILTSSRAVYGEGAWRRKTGELIYPGQRSSEQLSREEWDFSDASPVPHHSEETVPGPSSIYGSTKIAQEHIISTWSQSYGVESTIFRFQNVYGPGQSLINQYTGIVTLFARLAKEHKSIPLYEDGLMIRDFVFIDDVADSVFALVDHPSVRAGTFDVGTGRPTTIKQIAELIAELYGAPQPHVSGQFRNGDVRHAWADQRSVSRIPNWEPKHDYKFGMEQLCRWIDCNLSGHALTI